MTKSKAQTFKYFIYTFLSLIILGLFVHYYYLLHPQEITKQAHQSLKSETNFASYLAPESLFLKHLLRNHESHLNFYQEDNSMCLSIFFDKEKSFILKDQKITWTGTIEELSDQMLVKSKPFSGCSRACPRFLPSGYGTGSFCIHLNQEGRITQIDEPYFWF